MEQLPLNDATRWIATNHAKIEDEQTRLGLQVFAHASGGTAAEMHANNDPMEVFIKWLQELVNNLTDGFALPAEVPQAVYEFVARELKTGSKNAAYWLGAFMNAVYNASE